MASSGSLAGAVAWRYLAVPVALLLMTFAVPALMALAMSLLDYSQDLYAPAFVGLENYRTLLTPGSGFWQATGTTFTLMAGVVPGMVTLPIGLALLLNAPVPGISVFRALLYLPVVVSIVVVGLAWKWLLAGDGLVNGWLTGWGLPRVPWLVDPTWALLTVMGVILWKGLPYYAMVYLAQLQRIPADLYEAAALDGAGPWRRFWWVTLPQLRPAMGLVAIISTIGSLKIFTEVYVMTRGGPLGRTRTLVYSLYQLGFEQLDLGAACAGGLLMMALLLVLTGLQRRLSPQEAAA